jgi:hypothetical protein
LAEARHLIIMYEARPEILLERRRLHPQR